MTRLELGNQLNGDMVQTNGTVNLGNKVNAIGENSGKTSTYTMTGGSINVAGGSEFIVGSYGTGVFNQSGGSVTLNEWFSLGRHGGNGTYTMTGGSLTANHTSNGPWIGADNGTGTLTIGSGATATFKGGLDNGRNNGANSKGYLNLNGGTLTVAAVPPVGNMAVSSGTLVVPDKILVTCGETLTASGTIDLTNAKVELVDPENLTTGFYFIKPAPNETLSIVGNPRAENLPKGWKISVTSTDAKIQKRGFSIHVR